jgi:hypothetical protein
LLRNSPRTTTIGVPFSRSAAAALSSRTLRRLLPVAHRRRRYPRVLAVGLRPIRSIPRFFFS